MEPSEFNTQSSSPPNFGFGAMMGFQSLFIVFGILIGYWAGLFSSTTRYSHESTLASANWFGLSEFLSTGLGILVGLAMFLAIYCSSSFEFAWSKRIEERIRESFLPLLKKMNYLQLFLLAAIAGVGEELCFRWALQGSAETLLLTSCGPVLAWILSLSVVSLLFGVLHAVTPAYFLLATSISLLMGIAVPAGLGIWGVMVAHGFYDFLAFIWLLHRGGRTAL